MLLHKTVRCQLEGNAILSLIDEAIPLFGHTRLKVAEAIISTSMEESVKVWFEEDVIAVQLPAQYVELCTAQGDSSEKIVLDCLNRGLRWLKNGKK